jgi:hypothetical protein
MRVLDILTSDRVSVACDAEGLVRNKAEALRRLAELLSQGQEALSTDEIEQVLGDRERLQSTGVGGGVAIPHGAVDRLDRLVGAVLLCPKRRPLRRHRWRPRVHPLRRDRPQTRHRRTLEEPRSRLPPPP